MSQRPSTRASLLHRAAPGAALALLGALVALPAAADSHRALFARGNAAFAHGDYTAAAQSYAQLVDSGVDDADVYFDLALSHAKAGAHGRAIYWLERALVVAPGDDDAEAAIAASQAALGRRRAAANGEATVQTRPPFREAAVRGVRADTLAVLVLALSTFFFGTLVALRFAHGESTRLALWIAMPLFGLGLGVLGLGLAQKVGMLDAGDPAIVLDDDLTLREAPDPRASTRGALHEGERVRVVGHDRGWARVRAPGGREGWLRDDMLGTLARDKR